MTNTTTTDTATDTQDLGEVRHLDPATLVLDDNVRTDADATITAAFVRSVAERVRVPLLAYENEAGEAVVWDGQRRLLAAREAGLGTVPVYITSRDAADEQATTVERITGQVITADQRADLTQAQRVTAMRQLHLAGLSATRIAKALHTDKRAVVDPALKAATSQTAVNALDEHALTLEQYASAFLGGVGPVSTLVALMLSSVHTDGLSIRGIGSWISATVLVWLITALATVPLPMVLVKKKLSGSD